MKKLSYIYILFKLLLFNMCTSYKIQAFKNNSLVNTYWQVTNEFANYPEDVNKNIVSDTVKATIYFLLEDIKVSYKTANQEWLFYGRYEIKNDTLFNKFFLPYTGLLYHYKNVSNKYLGRNIDLVEMNVANKNTMYKKDIILQGPYNGVQKYHIKNDTLFLYGHDYYIICKRMK